MHQTARLSIPQDEKWNFLAREDEDRVWRQRTGFVGGSTEFGRPSQFWLWYCHWPSPLCRRSPGTPNLSPPRPHSRPRISPTRLRPCSRQLRGPNPPPSRLNPSRLRPRKKPSSPPTTISRSRARIHRLPCPRSRPCRRERPRSARVRRTRLIQEKICTR